MRNGTCKDCTYAMDNFETIGAESGKLLIGSESEGWKIFYFKLNFLKLRKIYLLNLEQSGKWKNIFFRHSLNFSSP